MRQIVKYKLFAKHIGGSQNEKKKIYKGIQA